MSYIQRKKLAGMNMHYKFRTLDYFLESQSGLGLETIEVWCARPHFLLDDYGYEDTSVFKKKAAKYGLTIGAFSPECTVYNYNLCAHDEMAARHSMGYFENGIKAAGELGAGVMVINCCGGARDEEPERIFDRAVKNLGRLASLASECGVVLAVETVRADDSPVINTLPELLRLLKAVDHKNVQACLDLTAAGLAGETMRDWFEALGNGIKHIRFVDGRPHGRLVWGDGLWPLEDQLEVLEAYDYSGYLSLAVNDARYLEDPKAADERNMAVLKPFLGE